MSDHAIKATATPHFQWQFLMPRYWGIWLLVGVFAPTAYLPWPIKRLLGIGLAKLMWLLAGKRRHETLTNLRLCFSDAGADEHMRLAKACFSNAGIGLFESITGWVRPQYYSNKVEIIGFGPVNQILANGQGVLLMGTHTTVLDLGGVMIATLKPASAMYRPQNNKLLDYLLVRARSAYMHHQVSHRNMLYFKRLLDKGNMAWYAPDQDYGLRNGVMAPFFGVNAATVTAQRRLLNISRTVPVMVTYYRVDGQRAWHTPTYRVVFTTIDQPYPTADEQADAALINFLLEREIRRAPEQYMWFHRRFKTRPHGEPSLY